MPIAEMYNQVTTLWQRTRADVLSHLLFAAILWIAGYSLVLPVLPPLDPVALVANPWFVIADKFGLGILGALVIVLVWFVYFSLFQTVGALVVQPFVWWVSLSFQPGNILVENRRVVEAIVRVLPQDKRTRSDVMDRFSQLTQKAAMANSEALQKASAGISDTMKSSFAYFRNAAFFLVVWVLVAVLFADAISNVGLRGGNPVIVFVLLLVALFITSRWLMAFMKMSMQASMWAMSEAIVADPSLAVPQNAASDDETVRTAANKVIREIEKGEHRRMKPVLSSFIASRFRRPQHPRHADSKTLLPPVRWHRRVVRVGKEFEEAFQREEYGTTNWLPRYFAYQYASFSRKLSQMMRMVARMLSMIAFGPGN